jgi:formate dehydrogenase subunit gamma
MRASLAALVLAVMMLGGTPAVGQNTSPTGSNPTAQSVTEEQVLSEFRRAAGHISIPDQRAAVLIQPQGRDYQSFHEVVLPWVGGLIIILALLAVIGFYWYRGTIELERPPTGVTVKRFSIVERLFHWTMATSFIVLAITGLNYVFGKRILFPLIGPDAFATWTQWAKYIHNAFAWPFLVAVLGVLVMWIRDNLPDRYDAEWLRRFGGFMSHESVRAGRFNAGQKITFWIVVLFGGTLIVTGLVLLFPFLLFGINGMQIFQYIHAITAMVMIGIIIGHIYIGTLGMQGAFQAMSTGDVDLEWAREHHGAWADEVQPRDRGRPPIGGAVPAE